MRELKDDFLKKLEDLHCEDKREVEHIFSDTLNKCILFYTQREATLILNEEGRVVGVADLFLEWFQVVKESIIGRDFLALFDSSYSDILGHFLEKIGTKSYVQKQGIYLRLNGRKFFLDLSGEKIEIKGKIYYLISFKDKKFDVINYKLALIEEKVAEFVLRIKDFSVLVSEFAKILIKSELFEYIWIGKVDTITNKVIPIIEQGDSHKKLEEKDLDHILKVIVDRRDLFYINEEENRAEIVFPLINQYDIKNLESVPYVILSYSKQNILFRENELIRLREIVNKLNIAIKEIYLKELAKVNMFVDPLTHLPLRRGFVEKIEDLIKDTIPFCVAIVDLDHLGKVNDVLGFWAGDFVLKEVTNYLNVLDIDFLARIGSDEFALLIKGEKKRVYEILDEVLKFNERFITIANQQIYVSLSIAASFFPEDGKSVDELIIKTEKALDIAKSKGGKRIEFANENLLYLPKDYLELEKELKDALEKEEYLLYYQPIIDLKEKRVCGVEALLRWNSPRRGLVSPGVFIPILEDSSLINEVGDWIIGEACKSAKEFEEYELSITFSMNISVQQMLSKNIAKEILTKVQEIGANPKKLIVEITESLLMENIDLLQYQLQELVAHGIRLEIDDFGTGYSSLSYLKNIPSYAVKIDKSFIDEIEKEEDQSLVQAIVAMAKALGKKTVAEGVETKEQLELLEEIGVDMIQGYYFAKPMRKEELSSYIENFDIKSYQ